MADTVVVQADSLSPSPARPGQLDRLASFRFTYLAIFAFLLFYLVSIEAAEALLDRHFRAAVHQAVRVSPMDGPIIPQIQSRVSAALRESPWTRWGGVHVNVTVIGADGQTPIYVGSGSLAPPPPPAAGFDAAMRQAIALLPPIEDVTVSVPHGSLLSGGLLVFYGAVLLQGLFLLQRRQARGEEERLGAAVSARDDAAQRARAIEDELEAVRQRLRAVEPAERSHAAAIRELEAERVLLQQKLRELAQREEELRSGAQRGAELQQEHQALEDLLEEALEDVGQKDRAIQELQDRLASVTRPEGKKEGGGRARESERIGKRLRTLYKNLEFDERAIDDLVALGDESLRLRAEESLKRLSDESESAAVRRKVGGLPAHLSVFELGFAGKGRIYYRRSEKGGFQILAVGGKATQKQDLEYLSRLG